MRIYVATKFEERERAREVMFALVAAGHSITYDWTTNEEFSVAQAARDRQGVMDADALVFIAEKDLAYRGAWVEFGIAVARNIPIYILGAFYLQCIFWRLANVHPVKSVTAVLEGLAHQVPADTLR